MDTGGRHTAVVHVYFSTQYDARCGGVFSFLVRTFWPGRPFGRVVSGVACGMFARRRRTGTRTPFPPSPPPRRPTDRPCPPPADYRTPPPPSPPPPRGSWRPGACIREGVPPCVVVVGVGGGSSPRWLCSPPAAAAAAR